MLLFHTMELMHCNKHPRPAQVMNKQAPVFQAVPSNLRKMFQQRECFHYTFKVPVEGNSTKHKTNEGKGSIKFVRRGRHRGSCNRKKNLE
jgi:hypothetical protein